MSPLQGAATIGRAVGPDGPVIPHLVADLLRRRVAVLLVVLVAVVAFPSATLASVRAVIDDYQDNGVIDTCHSRSDYEGALRYFQAHPGLSQYGDPQGTVADAAQRLVAEPGQRCKPRKGTVPATAPAGDGGGGGGLGATLGWVGGVVGVGAVGVGTGWWIRRRRN